MDCMALPCHVWKICIGLVKVTALPISSSHNHGFVENGVLEDVFSLQMDYFHLFSTEP